MELQTIVNEIRKLSDPDYIDFEGFPEGLDVSLRWSNAVHIYAKGVTPASLPLNSELGRIAFENIFKGIVATPPNALLLLPQAFMAYATLLATGQAPAFIGTPPLIPIIIAPVIPIGLGGGSAKQCAEVLGGIIHLWFSTGFATPSAGGSPIPWT